MRIHRVLVVTFLALATLLQGRPATAAKVPVKGPVRMQSLAGVPYQKVYLPGTNPQAIVCKLGQYGAPVATISDTSIVYFGERDTYWTFIELRPDSCPTCDNLWAGTLSMAHLALYFPYAPETLAVNFSVVQSVPIPCHYPNYTDPNAIICQPSSAQLICPEAPATIDFAVPIPPGCTLTVLQQSDGTYARAFMGFEFVSANDTTSAHKPQIATGASAKPCNSFNPVGFIPYDIVTEYQSGNPVMYAEVESCESTPTLRTTWGRLKLHYR